MRAFLFLLPFLCWIAAAQAPAVQMQWTTQDGRTVDVEWPQKSEWVWNGDTPALRIWFAPPPQVVLTPVVEPSPFRRLSEGHPWSEMSLPQAWYVDTHSPRVSSIFYWKDGRRTEEVALSLRVLQAQRALLVHPNCEQNGWKLRAQSSSPSPPFLFLAAWCGKDELRVSLSEDAEWEEGGAAQRTLRLRGGRRQSLKVRGGAEESLSVFLVEREPAKTEHPKAQAIDWGPALEILQPVYWALWADVGLRIPNKQEILAWGRVGLRLQSQVSMLELSGSDLFVERRLPIGQRGAMGLGWDFPWDYDPSQGPALSFRWGGESHRWDVVSSLLFPYKGEGLGNRTRLGWTYGSGNVRGRVGLEGRWMSGGRQEARAVVGFEFGQYGGGR